MSISLSPRLFSLIWSFENPGPSSLISSTIKLFILASVISNFEPLLLLKAYLYEFEVILFVQLEAELTGLY
jgi:hypothetical protein